MSLEADKSAAEAEVKHNFTLLAKSNTFRLKICESEENEKKFCDKVRVLKKKLKFTYLSLLKEFHISSVFKLLMLYHDFLLNIDD